MHSHALTSKPDFLLMRVILFLFCGNGTKKLPDAIQLSIQYFV